MIHLSGALNDTHTMKAVANAVTDTADRIQSSKMSHASRGHLDIIDRAIRRAKIATARTIAV